MSCLPYVYSRGAQPGRRRGLQGEVLGLGGCSDSLLCRPLPSSQWVLGAARGERRGERSRGQPLPKFLIPPPKKAGSSQGQAESAGRPARLRAAVPSVPFRKQPPRNPNPCWCRSCVLQVESPFSSVPREARHDSRNASQLVSVSRQPGSPGDRRPNSVTAPAHSIPEAPLAAGGWPRIWRPFRDSNKWQPDVLRGLLTPKNAVLSFLPW